MFMRVMLIWVFYTLAQTQVFEWPKDDAYYDAIVGIATESNAPIGQGIILSAYTIITSANPLTPYLDKASSIKVYKIWGKFNKTKTLSVKKIEGNQVNRKGVWIDIGTDGKNSPIHDFVLLILERAVKTLANRGPYLLSFPFSDRYTEDPVPTSGWKVAGFGYLDSQHIQNYSVLEETRLEGTLVDCDEWFPREWGRFICISNDENLPGVPSGGPLLQSDTPYIVFGLGCFSLRKGNESILVFTDLKLYRYGMRGYVEPTTTTTTTREPRRYYFGNNFKQSLS